VPQYAPNGCVITPTLIDALIKDNGRWARAVLGQCLRVPVPIQDQLLSGEAEWLIQNEQTLIVTLPESQ
jgi:hypothetical protein